MSTDDERELRRRLGGVLEAVAPSPAPVAATVRRGKMIRLRRQVAVAAGLAVMAGVSVGVPGLLRAASHEQASAGRPKVTVNRLGPRAAEGVIGSGTINGKRWQLVAQPPGSAGAGPGNQCYLATGAVPSDQACFGATGPAGGSADPAAFDTLGAGPAQVQYAAVAAGVTRLTVTLAGGTVLDLHPTEAYGQRYVAFAIPLPLAITRVVAYSARGEISQAIPFNSAAGDVIGVWLRPGQPGLPRVTRVVGSGPVAGGSWSVSVHAGPWGYCLTGAVGSCLETESRSLGDQVATFSPSSRGSSGWVVGTAGAAIGYARMNLPGGRYETAPVVDVGGQRFFAFAIPPDQRLVSVGWYAASGHELASESAAQIG
jgi:hypothetical protein